MYESNLDGYENLKFYDNHKLTPANYLINPENGVIINLSGRILTYHKIKINGIWRYYDRLVYEHVHGPIDENMVVLHKDNDPSNNKISNLCLIPKKSNKIIT
jgi:hypothetical protein